MGVGVAAGRVGVLVGVGLADVVDGYGAHGHDLAGTDGRPLHRGGIATVPGLGFVGLEFQRSFSSKTLRGVGRDAGRVMSRPRREAA
jgi:hypothetical protein